MKIYLDFDDTILDTGAFVRELARVYSEAGFSEKEFDDNWKKAKEKAGDFDLDIFSDVFAAAGEFDKKLIRGKVDEIFSGMDAFVHDDFFDFAREFGRDKLAILSFGTTQTQRRKIENSKIVPYVGEVIVTSRGKEEDFRDIAKENAGKKLFFVDDRAYQIDKVKGATPEVVAIKMERPTRRYDDKSDLADHVVEDFHEAAKAIRSNI